MEQTPSLPLLTEIVDRISVGILVVNKNYELVLWNTYMENYSQKKAKDIIGKNLFEAFPDLPQSWLEQKIRNVFILKNFSFTSWEHRPYLFKFFHNRPITGGIDYMRQNCTFLPIKGDSGDIEYVCITLLDVTDTSIYESMLKGAVRSLAESSNRDGLTNIYNRRFLEQTMSKEFARIKRYGGTLSFIIIDLDHFKSINDNYGHLAGDEILKIAAKRIGEHLRASDVLARYGGEEFAVLLPETPLGGAEILANRLCQNVAREPVVYNDQEINISASLGVAEFQPELDTHEQLISRADTVLYFSKENGRNQVTVYDHNNPPAIEGEAEEVTTEDSDAAQRRETTSALVIETADVAETTEISPPAASDNTTEEESQETPAQQAELPDPDVNSQAEEASEAQQQFNAEESDNAVATETAPEKEAASAENEATETEYDVTPDAAEADTEMHAEAESESSQVESDTTETETLTAENTAEVSVTELPEESQDVESESLAEPDTEQAVTQTETEISIEPAEEMTTAAEPESPVILEPIEAVTETPNEDIASESEVSSNPERELTAEEKADLAMIEAYGDTLSENNNMAETVDAATQGGNIENKAESDTIYVKLGSK